MSPKYILFLVFQYLIVLGVASPSISQNKYEHLNINSRFNLNQTIKIPKQEKSNKTMMIVARKATKNIFVDIPISTDDVGHTFIAILEYKDQKIIKYTTYGKYPEGLLTNSKDDYSDMTKIANNQDLDRLHFEELPMTDQQLQSILKINSQEGYYDLFHANCAHYTTKIMNVFLWYHNGLSINTENPAKYHAFFKNRRVKWD
jgi:hypothetical protein